MTFSAIDKTMRALRRGALAISFGALSVACAGGDAPTVPASDDGPSGFGATTTTTVVGGATDDPQGGFGGGASTTSSGAGGGETTTTASGAGGGAQTTTDTGTGTSTDTGTGTGTGTATDTGTGGGGKWGGGGGLKIPPLACAPIGEGLTALFQYGVPRLFNVQLPADTSKPMALLFLWHGWMQNPLEFANTVVYDVQQARWRAFDPNAFPMPLMIVTPFDNKMIPPFGLDWDIVEGGKDFTYFESMLDCIQQQYDIDTSRIYSFGFSAGAVFSNLLAAKYPHMFAATISESGAWFSDPAQAKEISVPIMKFKWPGFNPADGGNVLLTHGGPNDYATVISLENCAHEALPFLWSGGRTVTECWHGFGHTLAPDLTEKNYYDWMWAHRLGSPPIGALPWGFPTPWNPLYSTACVLHPAP